MNAIKPAPFRSPVQFLAFGFGSGLAPKAPGTVGTLAAVPIYWFIADWNLLEYSTLILVTALAGIWICGAASRQLQVHDHGGIVWDEFVGFWITMWAVPVDWVWIAAGFVVFRIFDIIKPWPISVLDKKVGGGFGIMIDDIVAGVMACVTLHIALAVVDISGAPTSARQLPVSIKVKAAFVAICLGLWVGHSLAQSPSIEVEALFTDAAVLRIDGQRKTLRAGQSYGGVTLVAAYSRTATLEVNGEQIILGLSRRIGASYQEPKEQVITIQRNANLQYQTTASINGRNVQVLVDTGANVVAMSSSQARALGIDYSDGQPGKVETASGQVGARLVTLSSVSVGGIQVENVRASVVMGDFPVMILLGMTYLQHVKIEEHNGVLSLSRAW